MANVILEPGFFMVSSLDCGKSRVRPEGERRNPRALGGCRASLSAAAQGETRSHTSGTVAAPEQKKAPQTFVIAGASTARDTGFKPVAFGSRGNHGERVSVTAKSAADEEGGRPPPSQAFALESPSNGAGHARRASARRCRRVQRERASRAAH